jgi:hypothetical protein
VIERCLRKDPEERYQSAREILAELRTARRSEFVTIPSRRDAVVTNFGAPSHGPEFGLDRASRSLSRGILDARRYDPAARDC